MIILIIIIYSDKLNSNKLYRVAVDDDDNNKYYNNIFRQLIIIIIILIIYPDTYHAHTHL